MNVRRSFFLGAMALSSSQFARFKTLLGQGSAASQVALERLAPQADSLTRMAADPERDVAMKLGLLWAAAHANVAPDQHVAAWTWLEARGLAVPVAWASVVGVQVLEQEDLALLGWLEERWGSAGTAWGLAPASLWTAAVRRHDTAALDRLACAGPLPAPGDKQLEWVALALLWHKDAAVTHVDWLLNHGAAARPEEVNQALDRAARQFYDQSVASPLLIPPPLEKIQRLQPRYLQMWDRLLTAGAAPHARLANDGVTPWERMLATPAQGELLARQRQATGHAVTTGPRRQHRARA